MAYKKRNFKSGDTLYASQLNAMDDQIAKNEISIEGLSKEIPKNASDIGAATVEQFSQFSEAIENLTVNTHNGVTIIDSGFVNRGSVYVTKKFVKADKDICIKGMFSKNVLLYRAEGEEPRLYNDNYSSAPIILKGYEGYLFEVVTPTLGVTCELVYGEIKTKDDDIIGSPCFNLFQPGNSSWGMRNVETECIGITVPIVKKHFKEMVLSYDCTAFILNDVVGTDVEPPMSNLWAFNGYNHITKDMIKSDYATIIVVPTDIYENGELRKLPINGIDYNLQNKFSLNVDSKDILHGYSIRVKNNLKKILETSVPLLKGISPNSNTLPVPNSSDFNGILYGGSTQSGTFLYHITPRMYYTALLNPLSCAYGNVGQHVSGYVPYGVVCSKLVSLLLGSPYPYTTMDYVYGENLAIGTVKPLNVTEDIGLLKRFDVMTQRYEQSGHCVMLTNAYESGDTTFLNILESNQPFIQENVLPLENKFGTYLNHEFPFDFFSEAYDFYTDVDYARIGDITKSSIWDVPFTEPQDVANIRGYGALYVNGVNGNNRSNNIYVSAKDGVKVFSLNGKVVNIEDLTEITGYDKTYTNGYKLYDVTHLVTTFGKYTITVGDSVIDEFYYKDISGATVSIDKSDDTWNISISDTGDFQYIEAAYMFPNGKMNSMIKTDLAIPTTVETLEGTANLVDINVVFRDEESQCTWWSDGTLSSV